MEECVDAFATSWRKHWAKLQKVQLKIELHLSVIDSDLEYKVQLICLRAYYVIERKPEGERTKW